MLNSGSVVSKYVFVHPLESVTGSDNEVDDMEDNAVEVSEAWRVKISKPLSLQKLSKSADETLGSKNNTSPTFGT